MKYQFSFWRKVADGVCLTLAAQTQIRFGLQKVVATRTPQLDPFMTTKFNSATKLLNKELARIQTFVVTVWCHSLLF